MKKVWFLILMVWGFAWNSFVQAKSLLDLFDQPKPIIGVIYLDPLPGYPKHPGMEVVIQKALEDLRALESAGVDGVLIENDNDRPYSLLARAEIIAAMSVVTKVVVDQAKSVVVGVEFLINDPKASLSIAKASGAQFIRTDYFVDRMSRPEYGGEIPIDPKGWMKFRDQIQATSVSMLTDIQVKYATMMEEKSLALSATQARQEGSDGIIVTGTVSGIPPQVSDVVEAKKGSKNTPVVIGSGLSPENAEALLSVADAAIVGTSMMTEGRIVEQKAKKLMSVVKQLRKSYRP